MALRGMVCIDLTDDVIKIDIYFTFNKKLEQEKISKIMLLKFKTF